MLCLPLRCFNFVTSIFLYLFTQHWKPLNKRWRRRAFGCLVRSFGGIVNVPAEFSKSNVHDKQANPKALQLIRHLLASILLLIFLYPVMEVDLYASETIS